MNFHEFANEDGEVLILRRIPPNRKTYGGFKWSSGVGTEVECGDWNPEPKCGGGLHGWPWGFGLGEGCDYDIIGDIWLVVGVKPEDVAGELDGGAKCKFRRGVIRLEGSFGDAMAHVRSGFDACVTEMAKASSGDGSTSVSSGYESKSVSSGYESTSASSGYESTSASSGYGSKSASSGDESKSVSSSDESKSASSGDESKSASSGDGSKSASSGDGSKSASSGDGSKSASSGYESTSASSGYESTSASSGDGSKSASSGYGSTSASSGYGSTSASSGYGSTSASSGDGSTSASSGYGSKSASSGDESKSASSGDESKSASSGDECQCEAIGKNTVAAIAGTGRIRVGERGAFAVAYYSEVDGWQFVTGKVGEDGIKADTWYVVENGKLVEKIRGL